MEFSQCNEERLANLTQPREEACLLNPCNVVAQLVTSEFVTVDTTVIFFSHSDVLDPASDHEKIAGIIHGAQHT